MADVQVIPGVAVISFSGVESNSVVLSANTAGQAVLLGLSGQFFEADDTTNKFTVKSTLSAYNFIADTNTFDLSGLDTLTGALSVLTISGAKMYVSPFVAQGAETYTNASPTTQTVGGIEAGTTFSGVSMSQMWTQLLYPYQEPAFSAFSFTVTTPKEVGYTISSGNYTFSWSTTNSSNISTNSIGIRDVTNSELLAYDLANTGSSSVSLSASIQKLAVSSHVWSISAKNTNDSTFSRNYTINWYFNVYYGESASPALTTSNDVTGLRVSTVKSNSPGTYVFLANNFKYIAYPSSYTTLTTFVDSSTLLNVAMEPYTVVSVTNGYGVTTNYNVHRTTNKLGGSINIISS